MQDLIEPQEGAVSVFVRQLMNTSGFHLQKIVFQQIEETEKRERLATRSDYITLQLKVVIQTSGHCKLTFGICDVLFA